MNFDQYRRRTLDPAQGYKPLDFGINGLTFSLTDIGRFVAINAYHPVHGYATMTSVPPFDELQRYNPAAVRAYRKSMAMNEGFGLEFFQPIIKREAWLLEDRIPLIRLTLEGGITAECVTFIPVDNPLSIYQEWWFSKYGKLAFLSGKIWLQRSAYTQLTEGGPVPIPKPTTTIHSQGRGIINIQNTDLGWAASFLGNDCKELNDQSIGFQIPNKTYPLTPETLQHQAQTAIFEFGLGTTVRKSEFNFFQIEVISTYQIEEAIKFYNILTSTDLLLNRALTYGLACCVPTSEEATCIITDHMLLPLSWNRDAYYVARMLLSWQPDMAKHVRAHLIWMWEVAERVNGMWGRSYLANGKVKDRGYQLDQQLFPILELAEYVSETGDRALLDRLMPQVHTLLDHLMQHKADFAPLFPTDETPADDPLTLPYHFSSHVLFWHALRKLTQVFTSQPPPYPPPLAGEDGGGQLQGWGSLAEQIKAAIQQYFVADHNGKSIYSYATDGRGSHRFYHDANDFPSVLAPIWGFCGVDDPVWRGTMEFAFSEANEGGYYAGRLGSVHTQAPWALGDVQDLILAKLLNDPAREQQARHQLEFAAQWDGALPEAYDADTGAVVSRHWFAWTNAAYACVELGAFKA